MVIHFLLDPLKIETPFYNYLMLAEHLNYTMNPTLFNGNFVFSPNKKGPIVFKDKQWFNLCLWNASEVMSPSFDFADLLAKMQHENLEVRSKNQRIWFDKINEYGFSSKAHNNFMEQSTNFPRIKLPHPYNKHYVSISKFDITRILVEHRASVAEWYADKKLKEKADPAALHKIQRRKYKNACQAKTWGNDKDKVNAALKEWDEKNPMPVTEPVAEQAEQAELVIEQVEVDDWEELE